jgi:hypothetical protein
MMKSLLDDINNINYFHLNFDEWEKNDNFSINKDYELKEIKYEWQDFSYKLDTYDLNLHRITIYDM